MSAIFISHSSEDNEFCEKLVKWLSELGHRSIFLDFDESAGIVAGQSWEQRLYQEIRACRAMIVVCTEDLIASKWCFAEITHARSLGKHIFPIKIAPCDISSILSDSQIVDFLKHDEKEAFQRLRLGLIKAGIDAKDPYDWDGSRPPYPGLLAFQEEDAAIFFGREKEIGTGLDTLTSTHRYGGSGLVMTLGASGSGKSSLVRAGIAPRLKRDPERWLVLDPMLPGDDPFRELAKVLKSAFANYTDEKRTVNELYDQIFREIPYEELTKNMGASPERSNEAVVTSPSVKSSVSLGSKSVLVEDFYEAADRKNASVLLVIDQFEELLNRPKNHLGSQFLSFLRTMLERKGNRLIVLGTMRSDFLGSFQQNLALLGTEFGKILVGPVDTPSLTEIIEKPAELAGIRIEPKLLQALIEDAGMADALPLLAFTLRELYDKYADDNLLDYREYKDLLGGIQGAVAKAAEGLLEKPKLSTDQENYLRKAFLLMARINDDGQFTRSVAKWNDMPIEIHDVLKRLVDGRLLVSRGGEEGEGTIEVAHEAIFKSWNRLRKWLDEDREFLLWKKRLGSAKEEWEYNKREKSGLLNGVALNEASLWFERYKDHLDKGEESFVRESLKAEAGRKRKRLFSIIGAMALLVLFGLTISVLLVNANDEKNKALANYLISQAQIEKDPNKSLSYSKEALKLINDSIIRKIAYNLYLEKGSYRVLPIEGKLRNYDSIAFLPGDSLIYTGYRFGAQIWNLKGDLVDSIIVNDPIFGNSHNELYHVQFNNNSLELYDKQDSLLRIYSTKGIAAEIVSAIVSPNNKKIITIWNDRSIHLYDINSGVEFNYQTGYQNDVHTYESEWFERTAYQYGMAAISNNGKKLIVESDENEFRVWDLTESGIINSLILKEDMERVEDIYFSPDGNEIFLISEEDAYQWTIETDSIFQISDNMQVPEYSARDLMNPVEEKYYESEGLIIRKLPSSNKKDTIIDIIKDINEKSHYLISPDEKWAFFNSEQYETLYLRRTYTADPSLPVNSFVKKFRPPDYSYLILGGSFSEDSKKIIWGAANILRANGKEGLLVLVELWDLESLERMGRISIPVPKQYEDSNDDIESAFMFSPDGEKILIKIGRLLFVWKTPKSYDDVFN